MKHTTAKSLANPAAILLALVVSPWLLSDRDSRALAVTESLECDEANDPGENEDKVVFTRPTTVSLELSHFSVSATLPLCEPLGHESSRVHLRGPPLH